MCLPLCVCLMQWFKEQGIVEKLVDFIHPTIDSKVLVVYSYSSIPTTYIYTHPSMQCMVSYVLYVFSSTYYSIVAIITLTFHCILYSMLLDVPKQPTCMNGGYRELHQRLLSRLGARGQNGTRASAHVTFQRTTSERMLCFSAKLRRQRCCLAELCLQGIYQHVGPYTVPGRARARAKKDESERAHQVAFLYETGRLPSSYVGNWCRLPRLCT